MVIFTVIGVISVILILSGLYGSYVKKEREREKEIEDFDDKEIEEYQKIGRRMEQEIEDDAIINKDLEQDMLQRIKLANENIEQDKFLKNLLSFQKALGDKNYYMASIYLNLAMEIRPNDMELIKIRAELDKEMLKGEND